MRTSRNQRGPRGGRDGDAPPMKRGLPSAPLSGHLKFSATIGKDLRHQRIENNAMRLRILILFLAILPTLDAQKIILYLKGGGDLIVREYRVEQDRVRYYSLARSAWEEIPLEFVDLEQTRRVEVRKAAAREERAEEDRIERAAIRKARVELHRVPLEDGVYFLRGDDIQPVEQAEVVIQGSKSRTFLKVFAPVVVGKSTMEVEGVESKLVTADGKPMFYVRLERINRLMMVRLKDKKKSRVVQRVYKQPQGTEIIEQQEEVEVFRQQLAPGVYKVWPIDPIPPGNYALIEYTPGKNELRVWDFTTRAGDPAAASRS